MLEFGEYTFGSGTGERSYVLKTSQLSGKDGLLAAHEINADSSINEDGSIPKLIPFNEIPQNGLNPRELDKFERKDTERSHRNRTLNSDATLTSDVNPNLAKASLLHRIAGDSELKKNFEEWLKDKKDSDLAGSFMMSFVDQADPLKRVHRSPDWTSLKAQCVLFIIHSMSTASGTCISEKDMTPLNRQGFNLSNPLRMRCLNTVLIKLDSEITFLPVPHRVETNISGIRSKDSRKRPKN